MTSANTNAFQQVAAPAADLEDKGTFQVLVSYYDGEDFNGDWRWGADCPAVGCATDGRTREEALEMIKDAIQCHLSDYPPGPISPEVRRRHGRGLRRVRSRGMGGVHAGLGNDFRPQPVPLTDR